MQRTAAPESLFDNTEGKEADSHNNSSETLSSGLCASVHVRQICNKLQLRYNHTRGANKLHLKRPNTNFYKHFFEFKGAVLYNSLPESIRTVYVPTERSLCSALLSISDTFDQ